MPGIKITHNKHVHDPVPQLPTLTGGIVAACATWCCAIAAPAASAARALDLRRRLVDRRVG